LGRVDEPGWREFTNAWGISHRVGPSGRRSVAAPSPPAKKPPSGGSNSGAASASPPSRFERLTSLKPPALPGDIYFVKPATLRRSIVRRQESARGRVVAALAERGRREAPRGDGQVRAACVVRSVNRLHRTDRPAMRQAPQRGSAAISISDGRGAPLSSGAARGSAGSTPRAVTARDRTSPRRDRSREIARHPRRRCGRATADRRDWPF
jgi:hypothetical protein